MPPSRTLSRLGCAVVLLVLVGSAPMVLAVEPSVFELVIDGETFTIEANRVIKLTSKQDPSRSYEVALRIAPTQRVKLNSVQFDYDRLCEVQDDRGRPQRTARLTHEMGFTMLISDLGDAPLGAEVQQEAIQLLADSVAETLRQQKARDLVVGRPQPKQFRGTTGLGVTIHHRDSEDLGRTCYVYILNHPKFAVSCVVQFLDNDLDDIRELVGLTLGSFAPVR